MKQKKLEFIKPFELFVNGDDNWTDYIKLSEIKKGDVFYECDHGKNIKLTALSNPKKQEDGWTCKVMNDNYGVQDIFVSAGTVYLSAVFSDVPLILTEHEGKYGYLVE